MLHTTYSLHFVLPLTITYLLLLEQDEQDSRKLEVVAKDKS